MNQVPFTQLGVDVETAQGVAVETITPEMAKDYLEHNKHNRSVNPNFVRQYKEDIVNGVWHLNPDAIAFDNRGILLNGQHRLLAVIAADKAVDFVVARGLSPEAFFVTDVGKKRNAADVLGVEGFSSTSILASIVSIINPYIKAGKFTYSVAAGRKPGKNNVNTNQEVLDVARRFPTLLMNSVKFANSANKLCEPANLFSKKLLGVAHFFYAYQFEAAEEVLRDMATGENLVRTDAIYAVRRRFTDFQNKQQRPGFQDLLNIVFKGVNARLLNQPLTVIKFGAKETFTQPIGLNGEELIKLWELHEQELSRVTNSN